MEELIKQWRTEDIVNNLLLLKEMVLLGESEKFKKEWAGAGVIVTSNKEDNRKADVKLITKHAKPISFLLYKLKDIYKDYINYSNKHEFYSYIVNIVDRDEMEKEEDSRKVLLYIIDRLLGLKMIEKENYKKWIEFLEHGLYSKESEFLRFAVLWLSFASFLNERYPEERREAAKLRRFKKEYAGFYKDLVSQDKIFSDILTIEFFQTKDTGREFVENLQTRKEEDRDFFINDDIKDFSKFIDVIYQIRCNFFHGGKIPLDREDEKLVRWAYDAFLYFWKYILAKNFDINFSTNEERK